MYDRRVHLTDRVVEKYPTDFIVMMGPAYSPVTRDRLAGIRQSFEEHGIDESKIHVIDGICSSIQAEKALNDVIVKQEFPKTIIFSNQNCLEGLVRAI